MGGASVPGPVCSTRVGDDWIDDGTLCRAKSPTPGAAGSAPGKKAFDSTHIYSLSREARRKRAIDLEIIGGDYRRAADIALTNPAYLKQLIAIGSQKKLQVHEGKGGGKDLQFFIVRGGGEGFLPPDLFKLDADNVVTTWNDTNGTTSRTDFDENDIIAVFAPDGAFVASARLRRPTYVQGRIRRPTVKKVYDRWHNKTVSIYRNDRNPAWIPYLGLAVDDGYRDGSAGNGKVTIDLHKDEATNGCILITDPLTPDYDDPALRTFEPELIKKVLKAVGLSEAQVKRSATRLGKMRVVEIGW